MEGWCSALRIFVEGCVWRVVYCVWCVAEMIWCEAEDVYVSGAAFALRPNWDGWCDAMRCAVSDSTCCKRFDVNDVTIRDYVYIQLSKAMQLIARIIELASNSVNGIQLSRLSRLSWLWPCQRIESSIMFAASQSPQRSIDSGITPDEQKWQDTEPQRLWLMDPCFKKKITSIRWVKQSIAP